MRTFCIMTNALRACSQTIPEALLTLLLLATLSKFVTFNGRPVDAGRTIFALRKPNRVLRYGTPDDSFFGATTVGVERPVVAFVSRSSR